MEATEAPRPSQREEFQGYQYILILKLPTVSKIIEKIITQMCHKILIQVSNKEKEIIQKQEAMHLDPPEF